MDNYYREPVIVLSETPKYIEGIGILLRTRVEDNKTMTIYYVDNDEIKEYDMSKFNYVFAHIKSISAHNMTTYICIEPERSGFDIEVVNELLKSLKFYDRFIQMIKNYSKTFNKFYVNVVKGVASNVLNPAEMEHLLSVCPDTRILKFRSYSVPDYRLVSVNYYWERAEEITNNLKRSPVYIPKNNVKRNINKEDSQQMITYLNKPVIVINKKQLRPNGKPKIEGIGILVRTNIEANTFTIYYVDSKTVQDYKFKDYSYGDCTPNWINNLSISTYICLDKTRGFSDLDKLSYVLSKFDGDVKFDEFKFKLECDLDMYGKMYLNIKEGILVSILNPTQMEEILCKSPNTSVLHFVSYNLSYYSLSYYSLVSINYNGKDIEDVINQLKEGLIILDSYIPSGKDNFDKDTCTSNTISSTKDRIGFKWDWLDTNTKYDYTYAWFNPSRNCGKTHWLNNLGTLSKTFENITATEIEHQGSLKRFHQEYMKSQEVRKMLYKLNFTTTKGKRYASYGKHNGEEIPTITTIVNFGGRTGKATVDEKDYNERQGILEALGNAIYGSFETEYQKYCKQRNKEDKKLRICTVCGKLYDTQNEARACEKAHKERKEADNAKWIIRKEAIRRLKEQTYEDSVQSEMNRLKNKSKDEDKKNKTTE